MTLKMLYLVVLIFVTCATAADAQIPVWDRLQVTFRKFSNVPRTEQEAISHNWKSINAKCKDEKSPFVGKRYVLDNEHATILIFDIRGHVAGMQMSYKASGEYAQRKIDAKNHGLLYDPATKMMYLTAYFTDPSTICSEKAHPLADKVTGDRLMLYNGQDDHGKAKFVTVPLMESGIAGTKWVKGSCFPAMGMHYWYDISNDISCDAMLPFFALYYRGQLSGFGFISDTNIPGDRVEHPPSSLIWLFFKKETLPKCLPKLAHRSTEHVFLRNIPWYCCGIGK